MEAASRHVYLDGSPFFPKHHEHAHLEHPSALLNKPHTMNGYSGYNAQSAVYSGPSQRHSTLPTEAVIPPEDTKDIENTKSYQYYPGAIYESQSDQKQRDQHGSAAAEVCYFDDRSWLIQAHNRVRQEVVLEKCRIIFNHDPDLLAEFALFLPGGGANSTQEGL